MTGPKVATGQDGTVGARIASIRKVRGISQTSLGKAIGVSFQQVQKYEKGTNRVGAVRLARIAEALDVSVSDIFSPETDEATRPLVSEGAAELVRVYDSIRDQAMRREVLAIVNAAARLWEGATQAAA